MKYQELRGVIHDPLPMWLEAVTLTLSKLGVEVVHKATDSAGAIAAVIEHEPDLFVTALDFEDGGDGFRCICEALEKSPATKIVAMSRDGQAATVERALEAGAAAFVMKSVLPDDFAAAVRQVFNRSVHYAQNRGAADAAETQETGAPPRDRAQPGDDLTRRELEILRLVAEGRSNAELASRLWVTEQTVKFHLSNIYRKLGVRNRTQASMWAQAQGVLGDRAAEAAA